MRGFGSFGSGFRVSYRGLRIGFLQRVPLKGVYKGSIRDL